MQVACLDSRANCIEIKNPSETIELEGKSEDKLHERSTLIVNEAKKLLGNLESKKVVNVGVVGDIIRAFLEEKTSVIGTDFDPNITGKKLFGKADIYTGEEKMSTKEKTRLLMEACKGKERDDQSAKSFFHRKDFLANVLKGTVSEYADLTIREIMDCIEGDTIQTGTALVSEDAADTIRGENTQPVSYTHLTLPTIA